MKIAVNAVIEVLKQPFVGYSQWPHFLVVEWNQTNYRLIMQNHFTPRPKTGLQVSVQAGIIFDGMGVDDVNFH